MRTLENIINGRPYCYVDNDVLAIVVDGEAGCFPVVERIVDAPPKAAAKILNKALGLTEAEIERLTLQSMRREAIS